MIDHRGRGEGAADNVVDAVVGYQVVGDAGDGHTHCLLDQAGIFEAIRIHQGADQRALQL